MAEYLGAGVFVPENDPQHREYLTEAGKGYLPLQQCDDCGAKIYPARTMCPECRNSDMTWVPASGKGTIYSYYIVPHPINPAFKDFVPYPVILVELDEERGTMGEHRALRVVGNLLGEDGNPAPREDVAIGRRVEVTIVDLGDGWGLPQWKLSGEPDEHEAWQIPHSYPP